MAKKTRYKLYFSALVLAIAMASILSAWKAVALIHDQILLSSALNCLLEKQTKLSHRSDSKNVEQRVGEVINATIDNEISTAELMNECRVTESIVTVQGLWEDNLRFVTGYTGGSYFTFWLEHFLYILTYWIPAAVIFLSRKWWTWLHKEEVSQ